VILSEIDELVTRLMNNKREIERDSGLSESNLQREKKNVKQRGKSKVKIGEINLRERAK
jgi:hypothetical protein